MFDMVVDEGHGQVFVSGGSKNATVLVLTENGQPDRTIEGLEGATYMVLSDDGSTLYASLWRRHKIAVVDTSTLTTQLIDAGTKSCPGDLAVALGLLWYGTGCDNGVGRGIAAIDPLTSERREVVHEDSWTSQPSLVASAGQPDLLVAAVNRSLIVYDVGGGVAPSATVRVTRSDIAVNDLTLSADGDRLLIARSGPPYRAEARSTTNLALLGIYRTKDTTTFAALRGDGMVAAGRSDVRIRGAEIYLYRSGEDVVYREYDLGPTYNPLAGLAFGQERLYAVKRIERYNRADYYRLKSYLPRREATLKLDLNDRRRYDFGARPRATVHLEGTASSRRVSLWIQRPGEPERRIAAGEVNAAGNFTARVRLTARSTVSARFAGDFDTVPANVSVEIRRVRAQLTTRLKHSYAHRGKWALYHEDSDPVHAVRVAPNHAGDCVRHLLQVRYQGQWHAAGTTPCYTLSADSRQSVRLTGEHHAGLKIRIRADWRGDDVNIATDGRWDYLRFT